LTDKEVKEVRGKTAATLKRNARLYYRNIADLPICFNTFLVWFQDNVVSKNIAVLNLNKFVQDVLKLATQSHTSLGDYSYMIPKQNFNIVQSYASAPRLGNEDFDYFGMKFNRGKLQFVNSESQQPRGRVHIDRLRTPSLEINDDNGLNGAHVPDRTTPLKKSFFESRFRTKNAIEKTNKYLFLLDTPRSLPPKKIANFIRDSEDGIPHFFIGANTGLVKNIKFNLVENKHIQSFQMLRRPESTTPKFPLKGRYECEITMIGNNFFSPGMTIYLNPASLRLGSPTDTNAPINALGIMGYYQIYNMSSYLQAGTYETKINCRFVSPGNGLDEAGRFANKSPMGNI